MLFFMHLRHSSKLVWVFAALGFFGLLIMITIAMGDYVARGGVALPADRQNQIRASLAREQALMGLMRDIQEMQDQIYGQIIGSAEA